MNSQKGSKVSVIIPLYNQKLFIGEAIESILNQTYNNCEIIVVNDGSTDDPLPALEKYGKHIILINQDNKGLSGARNSGIKCASGKYIQFLDADDYLHPEKIRYQVESSEDNGALLSYCEIAQFDQSRQDAYLWYVGEIQDMFSHLYNFWHVYPTPIHSLLINREVFDKYGLFDEELKACEDRYFLSRLVVSGIDFLYIPIIGGFRRRHDSNMNKNRLDIVANAIKYYKKLNDEVGDQFFIENFGYKGFEMMCANLTYIYYLNDVAMGTGKSELKAIKKLMNEENVRFFAEPIPRGITLKRERLLLEAYLKRWIRNLKQILRIE